MEMVASAKGSPKTLLTLNLAIPLAFGSMIWLDLRIEAEVETIQGRTEECASRESENAMKKGRCPLYGALVWSSDCRIKCRISGSRRRIVDLGAEKTWTTDYAAIATSSTENGSAGTAMGAPVMERRHCVIRPGMVGVVKWYLKRNGGEFGNERGREVSGRR